MYIEKKISWESVDWIELAVDMETLGDVVNRRIP